MIVADYHTHTVYSHGTGSVLENALVAKEKGLKEIAITDHGFSHMAFNLKRKEVQSLRKDIDEAMEKTGVKIYLGVEANLLNFNGDIDVNEEDLKSLELIVMGFHKGIKNGFKAFFNFSLSNLLADIFRIRPKKLIAKNTKAYIEAVHRYPIDIISHLNLTAKVNVKEVAQACAETNTYLEINSKRVHLTKEEMDEILSTDVKLVISSDAHSPQRVGEYSLAKRVIESYGIPLDRIVNIKELINIKKKGK